MSLSSSRQHATVGGVVVTYFPDAGIGARLAAIAREVGPLLVVDNSAQPAAQAAARNACSIAGGEFTANAENRGLAAALNDAFARLHTRRIDWAVAFDQDSTPETGFVQALAETAGGRGPAAPPAVVGANWRDEARPDHAARYLHPHPWLPGLFQRTTAESGALEVTCVITSGSLFHLPTWRKLGGFDERLFLDLVDTDYCLAAQTGGHAVCVAAGARLRHRRGAKQPVRWMGLTWWPAFMPAARLYGLFRNRVVLFRRYGFRFPHWVLFEIVYALKILFEISALEDRKADKLSACFRGSRDGLPDRSPPVSRAIP